MELIDRIRNRLKEKKTEATQQSTPRNLECKAGQVDILSTHDSKTAYGHMADHMKVGVTTESGKTYTLECNRFNHTEVSLFRHYYNVEDTDPDLGINYLSLKKDNTLILDETWHDMNKVDSEAQHQFYTADIQAIEGGLEKATLEDIKKHWKPIIGAQEQLGEVYDAFLTADRAFWDANNKFMEKEFARKQTEKPNKNPKINPLLVNMPGIDR